MGARQEEAADPAVELEALGQDRVEVDGRLPVPQLADEEVALGPVEGLLRAQPAEEDVARGLHQPLADDHALSVVLVSTLAEVRLEHRSLRLLDLQEERVVGVTA